MNTTATSYSSGHSWVTPTVSRRGSTESVLSIQGKETDFAHDTSDTETYDSDARDLEYEPVTESEEDGPVTTDSSGQSDDEIISTKVLEVSMRDDGELAFADGEAGDSDDSDSEIDLHDYWRCAQCRTTNNNPLYRYCQKCFQVRKNFFPPRPKRKCKRKKPETAINDKVTHLTDLVDSGVDSAFTSQEFGQHSPLPVVTVTDVVDDHKPFLTASSTHRGAFASQEFSQHSQLPVATVTDVVDDHKPPSTASSTHRGAFASQEFSQHSQLPVATVTDVVDDHKPPSTASSTHRGAFASQEFSQHSPLPVVAVTDVVDHHKPSSTASSTHRGEHCNDTDATTSRVRKRRASSVDRGSKSSKIAHTDSDSSDDSATVQNSVKVHPLVKTVSDPSLTIESHPKIKLTKKAIANSLKEKLDATKDDLCIVCLSAPKSGVFVHGRIAHICCCYRCSIKVWAKAKRCPVCNSKVSNVLKAVVM